MVSTQIEHRLRQERESCCKKVYKKYRSLVYRRTEKVVSLNCSNIVYYAQVHHVNLIELFSMLDELTEEEEPL